MSNIIQLIASYKEAENKDLFNKISIFFEKHLFNCIKYLLYIALGISIIASFFKGFHYGLQTFGLFFLILTITLLASTPFLIILMLSHMAMSNKERLYRKLQNTIFVGDIFEVFDENCELTNHVLKGEKNHMREHMFREKGLRGHYILLLKDEISELIAKNNNYAIMQEEQDVLINNGTKVGIMLKTINDI